MGSASVRRGIRRESITHHSPVDLLPVQRFLPSMSFHSVPTVGEPEFRPIIATIFDECQVFTVGHRSRAQLERF